MDVKTKYNIGDTVFTIDEKTFKSKKFVVGSIFVSITNDSTSVTLYENDSYSSYSESRCFPSEEEMVNHITSKNS